MYTWYNKSEVCYAYLDDVPKGVDPATPISAFGGSKWFTRGWTLQELIAPKQVVFLAQDWSDIGTRKKLVDVLRNITGIDRNVLLGLPAQLSVAQRMSWAAHRVTTREEDVAYSLMGLFGINMPTIYGEGKQAFIRLQYEIMQRSTDHSVFTWESDGVEGFLAPNPACFQPSHRDTAYCDIRGIPYDEFARAFVIEDPLPEHVVTNHGIRIRLPVRTYETEKGDIEYVAALACQKWDRWGDPCPRQNMLCALRLRLVEDTINQYRRVGLSDVDIREAEQFTSKDMYLEHDRNPATFDIHQDETPVTFLISSGELTQRELVVSELMPRRMWEVHSSGGLCLTIDGYYNSRRCGVALFREERTGQRWAIVLGTQHVQSYSRDWTSLSSSFLVMDLLVENSDDLWANLPSEPDFDNDAARMIWEHYQGLDGSEGNSTHGIFLQPSTGRHLAQFFQRSILLGRDSLT
ncbi:hypothetical protein A0H81_10581 [Grifola frondosa]|uniref:DUF8212 domain-containing protein n=1 Tax=Grifola frondosa TaxID=5627 RepID=A0A1C7LZL7_GRIFR|nr:hypothetical protein A0H81_10581 [Grifola frondosa]